jgi:hypothetical protein
MLESSGKSHNQMIFAITFVNPNASNDATVVSRFPVDVALVTPAVVPAVVPAVSVVSGTVVDGSGSTLTPIPAPGAVDRPVPSVPPGPDALDVVVALFGGMIKVIKDWN